MTHWLKRRFIGLGIMAIALHAIFLFTVIPNLSSRLAPSYNQDRFADGYDQLADNLVAGNGYRFYPDTARTVMREPGYPVFLAGLLLAFGKNLMAVKLTNMILALATAWITIRLAKKTLAVTQRQNTLLLLFPPLLFLFNPGTLVAESRGGVEILFGLLIALFMLTVYRLIESNRSWDYIISGAVLGITVLVRSTPMLFPVFLLVYLLFFANREVSRLAICRNVAVMVVTMLAILSPWIIRNYYLTGKFVPTASVLGVSSQAGQYINTHLFEGKPWWLLDREAARERDRIANELGYPFEDGNQGYYQTFYKTQDEIRFSNYLFSRVVAEYKKSPLLFVRCLWQNVFNFWFAGKTWMATAANVVIQLPYLLLALIGTIVCVRNKKTRAVAPLLLFIGYVMAVHVPILAQARYGIPLVSLLSITGTVGVVTIRKGAAEARDVSNLSVVSSSAEILRVPGKLAGQEPG
jgi:Dolichyl-phosphate-mannose-protein mannosyltransferase